jgi:Zn-dependent protease
VASRPDRGPAADAYRDRQNHLSATPDPSSGGTAQGWSLKELAHDIPLNDSAREIVELAQRLAGASGSARTEPIHLLWAITLLPKNPAGRALVSLKANVDQLGHGLTPPQRLDASGAVPAPVGAATRYLLNNAHREAEQLGHYRVDALHLLLALLYKDSPETAGRLEQAGVSIYAVRQYLTSPQSAPKGVSRPLLRSVEGAFGVSPVFAIPVGAMAVGGVALWSGALPGLVVPLSLLFVVGGWVTSLCIHEFGHALVAYLGGDRSVAAAGYLSLNPLRYANALLSIGLPIVFLLLGGIGLPGGAVYLNEGAIRTNGWRAFASAAGPLGNLAVAFLIGWPFIVFHGQPPGGDLHFWSALAFLVFLQVTAIVLNLIPIPPFDGFGVIAPWLSIDLRLLASRLGMLPMLLLFFFLWQGGPISAVFWNFVYGLVGAINVPEFLVFIGQQQTIPRL